MSTANITATLTSGVQVVSTANTIAASVAASATDETLSITVSRGLSVNNNAGATLTLTNCNVHATDVDEPLTTQTAGSNTGTNGRVNLDGCRMQWNCGTARRNMKVTRLAGTAIRSTRTSSGGTQFLYTQGGGLAEIKGRNGVKTILDGIYVHEITGAPLTYEDAVYVNCGINFLNYEAGTLNIRGVSYGSGTLTGTAYTGNDGGSYNSYDGWINATATNICNFFDCDINLAKLALYSSFSAGRENAKKYYSRSEKYYLGTSVFTGANLRFTPTASAPNNTTGNAAVATAAASSNQAQFDAATDASGLLVIASAQTQRLDLLTQTIIQAPTTRSTGLTDPATVANLVLKNVTWQRRIRHFSLIETLGDVTPTSAVGSTSNFARVFLTADSQVTGTASAAAALTGIAFTVNGATIDVSITAARTGQEIYNHWKHWSSQLAQFGVAQNLVTLENGTLNITGTLTATAIITAGGNASDLSVTGSIQPGDGTLYNLLTTSSQGANSRLNWSGLTDTSLRLLNNSAAQHYFASGLTGTRTDYLAPGSTGSWSWVAERYGYKRRTGGYAIAGGDYSTAITWEADSAVTLSASAAAALTTLATLDDLYDRAAYERTTATGIPHVLMSKAGSVIDLGAVNLVVDATAATVWSYDSGTATLTVKATALAAGTGFKQISTTGTITKANGATITATTQDATGKTLVISGWPVQPAGNADDGGACQHVGVAFPSSGGVPLDRVNNHLTFTADPATGKAQVTLAAGTEYVIIGDAVGYYRSTPVVVDTGSAASAAISLQRINRSDGTPQMDGTQSAAAVAAIEFDAATKQVEFCTATGVSVWNYQDALVRTDRILTSHAAIIAGWAIGRYDYEAVTIWFEADTAIRFSDCPDNTGRAKLNFVARISGNTDVYAIRRRPWQTVHGLDMPETVALTDTTALTGVAAAVRVILAPELAAIKAKTDTLPADPARESTLGTYNTHLQSLNQALNDTNGGLAALENEVAAIRTKTDALPTAPAAVSDVQAVGSAVAALSIPTASATAAAVRINLAVELARLDDTISSRLAAAAYGTVDLSSVLSAIATLPSATENAAATWAYAGGRSLSVAPGLTPAQADTLAAIAAATVRIPTTPATAESVQALALAVAGLPAATWAAPTPAAATPGTMAHAVLETHDRAVDPS